MDSREQNEKKFGNWKNLAHGGRLYHLDVPGHHGRLATSRKLTRMKIPFASFRQEIRNEKGELVEIHEKYPEDKGHQRIEETS